MNVYLVFQNDGLLGLYSTGEKAEKRLNEVKNREAGEWRGSRGKDKHDPFIQNWWQPNGRIARLSIELEEVE